MRAAYHIPVFITISFIIGVSLGFFIEWQPLMYWIGGGLTLLFITAFIREKFLFRQDWGFGITAFLVLVFFGFLVNTIHQPVHNSHHYIQRDLQDKASLHLKVLQKLKSNAFYDNYLAKIEAYDKNPSNGKILLSIENDSANAQFKVDDCLALYAKLKDIPTPLNPHQFDYAAFLANKQVLKQVRIAPENILTLHKKHQTLPGKAAELRQYIDKKLNNYNFSTNQINLLKALLLGQRSELSKEAYSHFAQAGVVHILAVSGLHIGILLYFFMFLFRPLVFLPNGKLLRTVIVIALLWGYAFLAGLSPSVLRAVTMFSFLSFGLFFKRRIFTINMLCLSALVLLVYNPDFLREVGFQLSYAAVLSIIIFQPKINRLIRPRNRILRYLWQITAVTIAAQLGVLPLSLFYFHQLPGLFFLSNLLIIPFMGIILGGGVFVLLLITFEIMPPILIKIYGRILDGLQFAVDWAAAQDTFLFQYIYFPVIAVVLGYLLIGFLAFFLYTGRKTYLFLILAAIILWQVNFIGTHQNVKAKHEFYVFHQTRHSVLGFRDREHLQLLTDSQLDKTKTLESSFVQGFRDDEILKEPSVSKGLENYYHFGQQNLFLIDSTGIGRAPKTVEISTVLLRNSPRINLERTLDSLRPQQVVADGSNYKSTVRRWRKTCAQMKIPFHYTGNKGAFILSY